jgi:hypothetical protein
MTVEVPFAETDGLARCPPALTITVVSGDGMIRAI